MTLKQFAIPWPLAAILVTITIFIVGNWANKADKTVVLKQGDK